MKQRSVLFISKGEQASSTRYRALNYFPLLRAHGWEARHLTDDKTSGSHRDILRAAAGADAVVLLRRTPGWLFGLRLRKASKLLVFDFDDAIFIPRSGRFSRRPARFRSIVKQCDHVWAGNSYLAGEALRFNSHVTVLPTSIEIERYRPMFDKPGNATVLVWIGSRSTRKYLVEVLPALEAACSACDLLRLKNISDFELRSEVLPIDNVPWSQATETAELASATIGIAPMREDPWTRGKCGLKVLQYMASGLPVITSPYGVNRDLVEEDKTGFHAVSSQQWLDAIRRLADEPGLVKAMGAAGRHKCESEFTLQATFKKLLQTLESANLTG
jgi:glycosyltransferase involved in cell wall biosynthesis